MKKTITAHICGMVFTFEEDAYEMLATYLKEIESKLGSNQDTQEILNDIESRIAELCNEQLTATNKVVTVLIITNIMQQLGDPSVFSNLEEDEEDTNRSEQSGNKKLNKRLFRHPTDNMLAGVCGGLAAYLNIDPIWFRLFFVIATLVFGFGIPTYIVLWIVTPEAKTTSEILQMQGEEINIENIKKKVNSEKEGVQKRWNSFRERVNNKKWSSNLERFIITAFDGLIEVIKVILRIVGGIIAVVMFIVSICLLLILIGIISNQDFLTFTDGLFTNTWNYSMITDMVLTTPEQSTWLMVSIIILLSIPCISLIFSGMRLFGATKSATKEVRIFLVVTAIFGAILLFWSGSDIVRQFSSFKHTSSPQILPFTSDTLTLQAMEDQYFSDEIQGHHDREFELLAIDEDSIVFGHLTVDVDLSADTNYRLIVKKSSNGENKKMANKNVENIVFNYQLKEKDLWIDPCFKTPLSGKWRNQNVHLQIEIPEGKYIKLAKSSNRIIYDVENITNTRDEKMVNHVWLMTKEGLKCTDCVE